MISLKDLREACSDRLDMLLCVTNAREAIGEALSLLFESSAGKVADCSSFVARSNLGSGCSCWRPHGVKTTLGLDLVSYFSCRGHN